MQNHTHYLFECNRSGTYAPKNENQVRQLKAQGTVKLGFHCTSSVQVKEFAAEVIVTYYSQHYKHSIVLHHLPIPIDEKEIIAGNILKICNG